MKSISHKKAVELLAGNGQSHVLRFWARLGRKERASLLAQIDRLDFAGIARMKQALARSGDLAAAEDIKPATVLKPSAAERRRARCAGEKALGEGKVGAILVAGGQGSRLGFDGPKGCFAISPISGATLFEIHCRKILALERKYRCAIPFYIMTSRDNNVATRTFLADNRYFGLRSERVLFFVQGMWPALDAEGHVILDNPWHIFMSPDGHGGTLSALGESGMLDDMARRKLTTLFYFQVDNPLVEIADPVFIGLHNMYKADMSVKVCGKRDPEEGLGVVVESAGKNRIVEYTELTAGQKHARTRSGQFKFNAGSVAIHVFSLGFLRRAAALPLPLHVAYKKVPFCDARGRKVKPAAPNAFKFEKFIFDALPRARRSVILEFLRQDEFSPVKNAAGNDSPETVRKDMVRKFAGWFEQCGIKVPRGRAGDPEHLIEIDPCFAVDAAELRRKLPAQFRIKGNVVLRCQAESGRRAADQNVPRGGAKNVKKTNPRRE